MLVVSVQKLQKCANLAQGSSRFMVLRDERYIYNPEMKNHVDNWQFNGNPAHHVKVCFQSLFYQTKHACNRVVAEIAMDSRREKIMRQTTRKILFAPLLRMVARNDRDRVLKGMSNSESSA